MANVNFSFIEKTLKNIGKGVIMDNVCKNIVTEGNTPGRGVEQNKKE